MEDTEINAGSICHAAQMQENTGLSLKNEKVQIKHVRKKNLFAYMIKQLKSLDITVVGFQP